MRKIAIIHDWLTEPGGAEVVLENLLSIYENADLFVVCDFLSTDKRQFLNGRTIHSTFIQNLPFARRLYRQYLILMPLAIEQLDLSSYDIILSSSYAVAKGVITGPDQLHVCYMHSPMRYVWHLKEEYLRQSGLGRGIRGWVARALLHKLKAWDAMTTMAADVVVANSRYIGRAIKKFYGKESVVVYPPVDVHDLPVQMGRGDYFVTASRMVPYKRMDLIVKAFAAMPDRKLLIVGVGPEEQKLFRLAKGCQNITFTGYLSRTELLGVLSGARAFVFAAMEDFGIAPVEAQACGVPVIAFGRGGARETIIHRKTGILFEEQTEDAIIEAVKEFEALREPISADNCRANASRFTSARFRSEMLNLIERAWCIHKNADDLNNGDECEPDMWPNRSVVG